MSPLRTEADVHQSLTQNWGRFLTEPDDIVRMGGAMRECALSVQSALYLVAVPREFSTGYRVAFNTSFLRTTSPTSMPRSCAR